MCLAEKNVSNTSQHLDNWIKYPGKIYFIDVSNPNVKELSDFLGFEVHNLNNIVSNTKYENKQDVIDFFEDIHRENLTKIRNKNSSC